MQVYKKILVTMDCSPVDDAIVEHVAALARQNNAKVHLLHVVHSHTLDQDRTLREKAQTALKAHHEILQRHGVDACIVLRSGEPEKEILAEIEGKDYDLVAMATHGHTFMADALLGSVSKGLKHRLRVPLLLIRGDTSARH
jgi:nucleotide-binding universal stress UspA family protein